MTTPSEVQRPACFVAANGISLAYETHGESGGSPIVLLHGLGGGRSSWSGVAESLASLGRVYVLDIRGHGASDWPGTYSFEHMADDVLHVLDALDLRDVTLVGHSMGGVASVLAAQSSTECIARIVLEDTPLPRPDKAGTRPRTRPDGPLSFDWGVVEAIVGQLNHPSEQWWDGLLKIDVPVLLVAGGPTSTVNQELIGEMASAIPAATMVTIPAGHHVHLNQPDEFLAVVREFAGSP